MTQDQNTHDDDLSDQDTLPGQPVIPLRPDQRNDDAHDLLPPWLAVTIPALYSQEENLDPIVHAKFFTPDSSWKWYVLEYSAVAPDGMPRLCFGLVCGHDDELGYFSLDELTSVRGPLGLRVERDLWWKPVRLSAVQNKY